jgi:hypothetical protein
MTHLTKKLTSENYIFIPKKSESRNPVGGVRMRSWDHGHHDIPLPKKLTSENYILIPKKQSPENPVGGC